MKFAQQTEARKGDCIDTFTDKTDCLKAGTRLEALLAEKQIRRELVYTTVPSGTPASGPTWQIYLLP